MDAPRRTRGRWEADLLMSLLPHDVEGFMDIASFQPLFCVACCTVIFRPGFRFQLGLFEGGPHKGANGF